LRGRGFGENSLTEKRIRVQGLRKDVISDPDEESRNLNWGGVASTHDFTKLENLGMSTEFVTIDYQKI
jgi:hypothetical protein